MKTFLFSALAIVGLAFSTNLSAQGLSDKIEEDSRRAAAAFELRRAMLGLTKQMVDVVSGISSVEDVESAEGRITGIFDQLVAGVDKAMELGARMEELEGFMDSDDPELREWSDKVENLVEALEMENPEASARLEQVIATQGMRLMSVIMQHMSPEDMTRAIEDEVETAE